MADSEQNSNNLRWKIVDVAEESDMGPREAMEDASYVCTNLLLPESKCLKSPAQLHAVFDGHGGDKCSQWLKENLHHHVVKYLKSEVDVSKAIEKGFLEADRELLEQNPEIVSGSTCIACLIEMKTGRVWIATVGDSRCVISRQGFHQYITIFQKMRGL